MKNPEPEENHAAQAIGTRLSREPEAAELRTEICRLKEEIERLNHESRREHEMYVRNLADFDNYRRRVERELALAAQSGKRELILPLMEVMDDFERVLERANDDPQLVVAGVRVIHRRLAGLLVSQSVAAFDSRGQMLQPASSQSRGPSQKRPGRVEHGDRGGQSLLALGRRSPMTGAGESYAVKNGAIGFARQALRVAARENQ
jgi:molecular chaperone GrpE